jgi:hypothetical protein
LKPPILFRDLIPRSDDRGQTTENGNDSVVRHLSSVIRKVGFPIRKSADQSSFAAPRGLSQRSTSFIASQRQGIHQTPLRHLIALIINARPRCRMSDARCQKFSDIRSPTSDLWFSIDRKTSLLRDRPEGACGQAALGCGSPTALGRGDFFGSIPSSRCQTTRALERGRAEARDVRRAQRCFFFGRASILLVEPDGIEPTTSCLQSRRSPN